MTNLTDFLLARIAEDEGAAKMRQALLNAVPEHERAAAEAVRVTMFGGDSWSLATRAPDPARVLAECEAKRRIVEELAPDSCSSPDAWWQRTSTLEFLALPYADHPDYREEWKP